MLLPTISAFDGEVDFWLWLVIVAVAAFGARLAVELWKPGPAGQPAEAGFVGTRWERLGVAWLVLLAVAVVAIAVLVLLRMGGPLRPA